MTTTESSGLTPSDASVALRSFPRRYREVFARVPADEVEELAARLGPEGESAADVVGQVTRTWTILTEALRQILFTDGAVLHPAVADPSQRSWDAGHSESIEDGLVLLGHEADAMADLVGQVEAAGDWGRSASVAGGGRVTALEVLGDAVQTGAAGLRRTHAVLDL